VAAFTGRADISPPAVYEEWLACFELLKSGAPVDAGLAAAVAKGSFAAGGCITGRFNQKLAETVNEMLGKRTARFMKDLNLLISLNEFSDIAPLFVKLRNEIQQCMFFVGFDFLDEGVKRELESSVKTQTGKFWNDATAVLRELSAEHCDSDLEDSLFLIGRIDLFCRNTGKTP
jgi:hypothetical protein